MNPSTGPQRWSIVLAICGIATWFAFATVADCIRAHKVAHNSRQQRLVAVEEEEVKQLLVQMDTDKSGTISKDEFVGFLETAFHRSKPANATRSTPQVQAIQGAAGR